MAENSLYFRPAHALAGAISDAFSTERATIRSVLPTAQVLHTGATSVAGALTRGDLDIHVRVQPVEFESALDRLRRIYVEHRREMWKGGFATFLVPGATVPTGVALTAIDGEHDQRFLGAWERLRSDPELLSAYNDLKLSYDGATDTKAYDASKSAFFSALVAGNDVRGVARGS
jgi:GrpB-like predicted nucleotidyltransferase (UPF0157 family)